MAEGVMGEALFVAAALLLLITAIGLVAMGLRGGMANQMMGVQLLGSGGIGVLLLLTLASGDVATLDVALLLALLAAVAAMALRGLALKRPAPSDGAGGEGRR
ncbi:monovalent cation/H+ antiporter complex subunit F [Xanthobacter sp. ZOL 2024]